MIDWSGPLEAVNLHDGRVVAVEFVKNDGKVFLPVRISPTLPGYAGEDRWFDLDGTKPESPWRIRNVQPPAATPEIPQELQERMVALVLGAAEGGHGTVAFGNEARAIAALLPKTVDPDLVEAREIAAQHCDTAGVAMLLRNGKLDDGQYVKAILFTLKQRRRS